MALDDRARLDLHQRLEEVLGPESAATMMAHLPPSGWGDVATKADLARMASGLRADLEAQIDGLRVEMHRSQRRSAISLVGMMTVMNSALVAVVAALR
jgi:hypothetical protein